MIRRASLFEEVEDENVDSGAETAESDSSKMPSSTKELRARRLKEQQQQVFLVNLHLLANPGDSLLLQHTADQLLRWLCPSLRIFHVSERASPLREYSRPSRLGPLTGYPSLAVTFFLHEVYGEERILRVLDFFQRPPWQYHHTESCGSQGGGGHMDPRNPPTHAPMRPYLLPSRDFYSLGAGMPVWGVRPVHCGGETLRVTLFSAHDNYEDEVRLYETVLQQRAEEQKTGFCWFTLHTEPGLCLQLAIKQLPPGVRVEPCSSAVLQFSVEEVGQLVPLLPNPCTPISTNRWQTEDLDGNKILFQATGSPSSRAARSRTEEEVEEEVEEEEERARSRTAAAARLRGAPATPPSAAAPPCTPPPPPPIPPTPPCGPPSPAPSPTSCWRRRSPRPTWTRGPPSRRSAPPTRAAGR
ncbi:unnamed protein product [Boreogadus saida]